MAYNEKQKEYTMNYLDKLKEIRFRVKPEEFEIDEFRYIVTDECKEMKEHLKRMDLFH